MLTNLDWPPGVFQIVTTDYFTHIIGQPKHSIIVDMTHVTAKAL